MTLVELPDDEMQILLAETAEHIQTLDEGLVRLEREGNDAQLLQAIFRAAHTLKSAAGMLNHVRMADLTHALETVLDGLRRGALTATTEMVDACLEALDALKLLHAEIVDGRERPLDIEPLTDSLLSFTRPVQPNPAPETALPAPVSLNRAGLYICVDISAGSTAPAGRAFQVLLALQSLGDVSDLQPPQAVIESGAPVRRVTASLVTSQSPDKLRQALSTLPDVARLEIGGEKFILEAETPGNESSAEAVEPPAQSASGSNGSALELARAQFTDKTVRTSIERLDNLMNLVGELITDRNRLNQIRDDFERVARNDDHALSESLSQTVIHLGRITDQLQEEVMKIRLLPVSKVFARFPRLVRDLARKAGKQAELVIRGEDTELDRSVIEQIGDPLIHLLRNAVDHGLESPQERIEAGKSESGVVLVTARHEESRIILTVEDDGRGIDAARVKATAVLKGMISDAEAAALTREEALDLIFLPGLTTASVVNEVSGRGVGMDIVRTNIERLNGNIVVESWNGQGTRFQIVLPLTLAIIPTLLVQAASEMYAVPLSAVMEAFRLSTSSLHTVRGKPVTYLRGHALPLAALDGVLAANGGHRAHNPEFVVAVRWGKLEMGLMVDRLIGEQELVVKPLGALVGETPGVSGAAILGDGRIALIADVPSLFKLASV